MAKLPTAPCAFLLAAALVVSACDQKVGVGGQATTRSDGQTQAQSAGFTTFPDLPMPTKADMVMDRTLVFGGDESWIGRLVIATPYSAHDMFSFYQREMPRFGWEEVTSIRAEISVQTYSRGERVATIQIQRDTLHGSEVAVTVSPRGAPAQGLPSGSAPPAANTPGAMAPPAGR